MEAVWKDDDHNEFCGGANSYKTTDGKVVFSTQAESYHHRGLVFAHYSQLEFECIIQLQEKVQLQEKAELTNKSSKNCGHKPRPTFPLGINHSLYTCHVGVIRMKMCKPMFAGAPPPKLSGNRPTKDESSNLEWNKNMIYYSRYLIDLCVPWLEKSSPCVCVNLTSRGERSLATPAYQGMLTLVYLPLGAAVNKIKLLH
jgi:hypothetical protein